MSEKKYVVSRYGERFDTKKFATREQAAGAAPSRLGLGPGDRFWTGVAVPASTPLPSAISVIEYATEAAYDEVGEASYFWLENVTEAERADLDARLRGVWLAWLKDHGHMPTYFGVNEIEEHRVPELGT